MWKRIKRRWLYWKLRRILAEEAMMLRVVAPNSDDRWYIAQLRKSFWKTIDQLIALEFK